MLTDEQLINYCELHCRSERALFHADHINRMLELAGHPEGYPLRVTRWLSAHDGMQELVGLARARRFAMSADAQSAAAPAQEPVALMTDEEREQLKVAIKATEYKYFGDYEFSEKQRAAVDTLTTFANRMLNYVAPVAPEWQPIETAPLNKNVLLWWRPIDDNKCAECAVIGQISFYEQGQWWNGQTGTYQDIWHVTKWMPLPTAPKPDA